MRLYAYIDPVLFNQYCRVNWLDQSDDSTRRYLRDVGTFSISFHKASEGLVEVPESSCLRLESKEQYTRITHHYTNLYDALHPVIKKEFPVPPLQIPGWTAWWSRLFCSWRF